VPTTGVDSRANNGFFDKGKRGEAKGGKGREIKREEGPRITISTLWIRILNGHWPKLAFHLMYQLHLLSFIPRRYLGSEASWSGGGVMQ